MIDRLTSMAAFVRAADLGSFTAAAAFRISPQMVAKHVFALEDRLGVRLLNRTTRKQSLTELGRAYCERCRLILAEADAADTLAQDARASSRGRLRVNAPVTFGVHSPMPLVTRYLRAHPDVQVDLTLSDRLANPVEEGYGRWSASARSPTPRWWPARPRRLAQHPDRLDTPFSFEIIGTDGRLRLFGGNPHGFQAGTLSLEADVAFPRPTRRTRTAACSAPRPTWRRSTRRWPAISWRTLGPCRASATPPISPA